MLAAFIRRDWTHTITQYIPSRSGVLTTLPRSRDKARAKRLLWVVSLSGWTPFAANFQVWKGSSQADKAQADMAPPDRAGSWHRSSGVRSKLYRDKTKHLHELHLTGRRWQALLACAVV